MCRRDSVRVAFKPSRSENRRSNISEQRVTIPRIALPRRRARRRSIELPSRSRCHGATATYALHIWHASDRVVFAAFATSACRLDGSLRLQGIRRGKSNADRFRVIGARSRSVTRMGRDHRSARRPRDRHECRTIEARTPNTRPRLRMHVDLRRGGEQDRRSPRRRPRTETRLSRHSPVTRRIAVA